MVGQLPSISAWFVARLTPQLTEEDGRFCFLGDLFTLHKRYLWAKWAHRLQYGILSGWSQNLCFRDKQQDTILYNLDVGMRISGTDGWNRTPEIPLQGSLVSDSIPQCKRQQRLIAIGLDLSTLTFGQWRVFHWTQKHVTLLAEGSPANKVGLFFLGTLFKGEGIFLVIPCFKTPKSFQPWTPQPRSPESRMLQNKRLEFGSWRSGAQGQSSSWRLRTESFPALRVTTTRPDPQNL